MHTCRPKTCRLIRPISCLALLAVAVPAHAATLAPGTFPPPAIRLTADAAASERPRVAIDEDGNAVVVWQDARYGNLEILWQKFSLSGAPLTGVERLTQTAASSVRPDVACGGAKTSHIVWQEGQSSGVGQVKLGRRSLSGTASQWDVSVLDFSGHARVAALANGDADVIMYRRMAADQDTYYRRYHLNGTYQCAQRFAAEAWWDVEKDPAIAVAGDGAALALWSDIGMWADNQLLQGTVDFTCSRTYAVVGGADFHAAVDIAGTKQERVFESGGRIYRLTPGGSTCLISGAPGGSSYPSVGTTATTSYAVWQDTRTGGGDIYFGNYTDCTRVTGDLPLILSPGASSYPDLAVNKVNGEWVAVWQEDLSGNTEVFMTSSRLLGQPPTFSLAGATFDKQIYRSGSETATISAVTQSFAGASANLTLRVAIDTNVQGHYDLGQDAFTLAAGASHVSTFTWPVPARDKPWDFSLRLSLYQGANLVASAVVPDVAAGTPLTQEQIDQTIAEMASSSCDPPISDCSMYLVGLVPLFGAATDLVSFKSDACDVGRYWGLGDYRQAAVSTFKMMLTPVKIAIDAIPGVSAVAQILVGDVPGVLDCAKQLFGKANPEPQTSAQTVVTIDMLMANASQALAESGQPYACEVFAQGAVGLSVGAMGWWTTVDTAGITQAFVFPTLGTDLHWAHVGPGPVRVGTSITNPMSVMAIRAVTTAAGPMEFGFLHRVSPDSVAWIRYPTIQLLQNSVTQITLSDASTEFRLYVDHNGDGVFEQYWLPDGTVVGVPDGESWPAVGCWLHPGRPNPTRHRATFEFGVPMATPIDLGVYDAAGRRVVTLAAGRVEAGAHTVAWNGAGGTGRRVAAGVYMARLITAWGVRTGKIVLIP